MDYLVKNILVQKKKKESSLRRDANVLNTPLLKLHIDENRKGHSITKTNKALSAEEQINLR